MDVVVCSLKIPNRVDAITLPWKTRQCVGINITISDKQCRTEQRPMAEVLNTHTRDKWITALDEQARLDQWRIMEILGDRGFSWTRSALFRQVPGYLL
jgi:hypothetical protein